MSNSEKICSQANDADARLRAFARYLLSLRDELHAKNKISVTSTDNIRTDQNSSDHDAA